MKLYNHVTECSTYGKKLKYYREDCSQKAFAEQKRTYLANSGWFMMVGGTLWACMVLTLNLQKYVGFGKVLVGVFGFLQAQKSKQHLEYEPKPKNWFGWTVHTITAKCHTTLITIMVFLFLCFWTLFLQSCFSASESLMYPVNLSTVYA